MIISFNYEILLYVAEKYTVLYKCILAVYLQFYNLYTQPTLSQKICEYIFHTG